MSGRFEIAGNGDGDEDARYNAATKLAVREGQNAQQAFAAVEKGDRDHALSAQYLHHPFGPGFTQTHHTWPPQPMVGHRQNIPGLPALTTTTTTTTKATKTTNTAEASLAGRQVGSYKAFTVSPESERFPGLDSRYASSKDLNGDTIAYPARTAQAETVQPCLYGVDAPQAESSGPARPAVSKPRAFDPVHDLNPVSPSSPPHSYTTSPTTYASWPQSADGRGQGSGSGSGETPPMPPSGTTEATAPPLLRGGDSLPHINRRYQLEVLEHPVAARASTYGDRDRRVINPPPVLLLSLRDFDASNKADVKAICWPYNIVHCTLWRCPAGKESVEGCVEVTTFNPDSKRREGGLMGSLVVNPFVVEAPNETYDEQSSGPPVCFYVFQDLSCRSTGRYRLRFELTHIGEDFLRPGAISPTVAYAWSEPFEVYSAKDFPGVRPSSSLLRYLKKKGAKVSIKKSSGSEAPHRKRVRSDLTSDEEVDVQMNLDRRKAKEPSRARLYRDETGYSPMTRPLAPPDPGG